MKLICRFHVPWTRGRRREITVNGLFAWYDLWVGAFWHGRTTDARNQVVYRLYVLPLPTLGFVIDFRKRPRVLRPLKIS